MPEVFKEIDLLLDFYEKSMATAKQYKNRDKYYQFQEAYDALCVLKTRLAKNRVA